MEKVLWGAELLSAYVTPSCEIIIVKSVGVARCVHVSHVLPLWLLTSLLDQELES
jgi:hypothetical protein